MSEEQKSENSQFVTSALEASIRIGLILVLIVACLIILGPFMGITLWGMILAVAFANSYEVARAKFNLSNKWAATIFVVITLSTIIIPSIALTGTLLDSASRLAKNIDERTLEVAVPNEQVKQWPIIGEKVYAFWYEASEDLDQAIDVVEPYLEDWSQLLINIATSTVVSVLAFALSLVIAGVFLAYRDPIKKAVDVIALRFGGEAGKSLVELSRGTINSVAVGVIGIALFQSVLGGLGMLAIGIPGSGLWALIILVLVIVQLPAPIVLFPAIIYAYSISSPTAATIFAVWSVAVGASDLVLKPMLLGRGMDIPMIVILLGAIGGMLSAGIIGLFVGAVILAVSYQLFLSWLKPMAQVQASQSASLEEVEKENL